MKIIILGAGQVGSSVAQALSSEANDITIVDRDATMLRNLQERLDVRIITGHASHPDVLMQAGIEDAELILAVTNSDETNMIACQIAHAMFHVPTRLARVRSASYLTHPRLFDAASIAIDHIISPEQLVTAHIKHLIRQPGVLQILDFADGRAQMVAIEAHGDGAMTGRPIRDLHALLTRTAVRVVAIYRGDQSLSTDGNTVIEADDEVFFLAARKDTATVIRAFRPADRAGRRIIIAGGGNIGFRLAEATEDNYRVKIIEQNAERCRHLAETLDNALVLKGDAADSNLLIEEDIDQTDAFCAVTNDDAANILSAMLAKRLGAKRVISIINRPSYVELAEGAAVDVAVSPALVTIGAILAHVRRGDVVAVHELRRGAAEAIEVIAHGDKGSSKVVGRRVADLKLPVGATVGALLRRDELVFADSEVTIESGDHVILFLADKRQVADVERLFQVAISFF